MMVLHEWHDDDPTVSRVAPAKLQVPCRCGYAQEGREDPMQLHGYPAPPEVRETSSLTSPDRAVEDPPSTPRDGRRSREARLTGEVTSEEVTEVCEGARGDHRRRNGGVHLTARSTNPAGMRSSGPPLGRTEAPSVVVICGAQTPHTTDQSYARDNRLIPRWSSYPAGGLAPRCRLSPSSRCSRWEGSDCSSVKGLRELG